MKPILSLLLIGLTGCGTGKSTNSSLHDAGSHYTANNCEIFIDTLETTIGSHNAKRIDTYVKILPSRLDGAIEQVGVRLKFEEADGHVTNWHSSSMIRIASDYYSMSTFPYNGLVGARTTEAVFFVRTDKGTTYWHKNKDGGNFIFDQYWEESVRRGLLVRVEFTPTGIVKVDEIPIDSQSDRRPCAE